jgi:3-dehydroquinate synthase
MMAAARLSARIGACPAAVAERIETLLARLGLPTEIPADLDRARLERAVAIDKKAFRDRIAFIACTRVGECREHSLAPSQVVAEL